MSRLLIVGVGYLGGEVARLMYEAGWELVGADVKGGKGLITCDVSNMEEVAALPEVDAVLHCASSGRGGGVEEYRQVYLEGCRNLVERYPEARMMFCSSTSVYAQVGGEVVDETSETAPERETGKVLLESEAVVLGAGGVVLRIAGIYGTRRSVLLQKFIDDEAVMEGDGVRVINQIHRDDAARAVLHLLEMENFPKGEIFNVSDGAGLTQREIYEALGRIYEKGMPRVVEMDVGRKRGWTSKRVSNAKLCGMGWRPGYSTFFDGV